MRTSSRPLSCVLVVVARISSSEPPPQSYTAATISNVAKSAVVRPRPAVPCITDSQSLLICLLCIAGGQPSQSANSDSKRLVTSSETPCRTRRNRRINSCASGVRELPPPPDPPLCVSRRRTPSFFSTALSLCHAVLYGTSRRSAARDSDPVSPTAARRSRRHSERTSSPARSHQILD